MATLYRYFKDFWKLAVVALILAAINQVFSLLDPLISGTSSTPMRLATASIRARNSSAA